MDDHYMPGLFPRRHAVARATLARFVCGLWLLWSLSSVTARETPWEAATHAGVLAFNQGHYTEAVQQFQVALATLPETSVDTLRLARSLMNLASARFMQGQYAQAASLYTRALGLQEQTLGPDHPHLVEVLNAAVAVEWKRYPVRSLLPGSAAKQLAARARRLQERDTQAATEVPPEIWFGPIPEVLGNDH